MDIFFLQLTLLFIPGIIWERIDSRYGVNRPNTQFDILRRAFCFGLVSYAVIFILSIPINKMASIILGRAAYVIEVHMVSLKKDVYDLKAADIYEIGMASFAATIMSIGWLFISNNKIPVRFMQLIGATKRYGDEDVWDFTFNSKRAEVEYVHVRDFDNNLTYSGWVELFSETDQTRELVLRDVQVSTLDGATTFETPRLYLARPVDNITIEFPYVPLKPQEKAFEQRESEAIIGSEDRDGRVPEDLPFDGGQFGERGPKSASVADHNETTPAGSNPETKRGG